MSAERPQSVAGPFHVISADVFQHLAPLRNPPGSRPGDVLSVVVLTDGILVSVITSQPRGTLFLVSCRANALCLTPFTPLQVVHEPTSESTIFRNCHVAQFLDRNGT